MKSLIILFLFVVGSIKAQTWETNELVYEFSDKVVCDIGFINNNILILSNYGLSIVNDSLINQYWFDESSSGSLDDFLVKDVSKEQNFNVVFTSLIIENKIIWIYSRDFRIILKIENGMIENYKFNFLFDKIIHPVSVSAENNVLWFFFKYFDSADNETKREIYYLENGVFIKFIPHEVYNSRTLDLFFVSKGYKYFVFQENFYENARGGYLVSPISKDSTINILFRNKSFCTLNFYCYEDNVYILSNNFNLLKLSHHKREIALEYMSFNNSENRLNFFNSDFLVLYDKLYIPSIKGLLIFDFNNFIEETLIPNDFYDHCFVGFDKIRLKSSKKLYLIYGNGLIYNCEKNHFGFSIYNIMNGKE